VWRGRCPTEPAAIAATVRRYAPTAVRIGLETGRGLPIVCLDARHAKKAPDSVNKNDANDGEGLAHLVRAGWYREVRVKSRDAMPAKALLGARSQLLSKVAGELFESLSRRSQRRATVARAAAEALSGKMARAPLRAGAFMAIAAQFKLDRRSFGFLQRLRRKCGDGPLVLVFATEP
jgi:hypothetical protein